MLILLFQSHSQTGGCYLIKEDTSVRVMNVETRSVTSNKCVML